MVPPHIADLAALVLQHQRIGLDDNGLSGAIRRSILDSRGVLADWLEEQGRSGDAKAMRDGIEDKRLLEELAEHQVFP